MKKVLTLVFLFILFPANLLCAELNEKETSVLASIAEVTYKGLAAGDSSVKIELNKLRIEKFNGLLNLLLHVDGADSVLFTTQILSKPNPDELRYYYAIREVCAAKRNGDSSAKYPEIIREVMKRRIDDGNLLDNYYYTLKPGIAAYFNKTNLKYVNIDLNSLGLKNETEKAICFLNITYSLLGPRFIMLETKRNYTAILELISKAPKFNGKEYYCYSNFDYEDFVYLGFKEFENYNERYIGKLYHVLLSHLKALTESGQKQEAQKLYKESILSKSRYFKYSKYEKELKSLKN